MNNVPEYVQAEIGMRIRRRRKFAGKTQLACGAVLGISRADLARIELGYAVPSAALLQLMADTFGCTTEWLQAGTGESPERVQGHRLSGVQIRHLRTRLNLSREELCGRIGIKPATLQNIELGHQQLGPAATVALHQLHARHKEKDLVSLDARQLSLIIERTIDETYRVVATVNSQQAVKALAEVLGDDEQLIVRNLVRNRIAGVVKEMMTPA